MKNKKQFLQGNVAAAEAALANGLEFYAGYPITPSTEALEHIAAKMDQRHFINAFSEVEAINLLYGAGAAGKRGMTATSGCGISLMREGLSYAVGAKVPMVIYNVMRFGPGLGGITPSTEDISMLWGVGHGQSKVPILTPSTVQEIADCIMSAFDIADALRMPVIVMVDATLGQMYEPVEIRKSGFTINKDWQVGVHRNHVITSRKVIQSYKTFDDEQDQQIKYVIEREERMYTVCSLLMRYLHHFNKNDDGKYIVSIGTTGRVVQDVAKKLGIGFFVPILLSPLKIHFDVKELTVVEVGGTQLYDVMKYTFPKAKIKSIVFSHAIPDEDEIIERINKEV